MMIDDLRPHIERLLVAGFRTIPVCCPMLDDVCSSPRHSQPCDRCGKRPLVPAFQALADKHLSMSQLINRYFTDAFNHPVNLAVVVPRGFLVIEADSPEADAELSELLDGVTTATRSARPGRGRARIVRLPKAIDEKIAIRPAQKLGKSKAIDVCAPGGLLVAPPSFHMTGYQYVWEVPPTRVSLAPPALIAFLESTLGAPRTASTSQPSAPRTTKAFSTFGRPHDDVLPSVIERVTRASAYIKTMPGSVSGHGGSNQCYLAALAAVRGFCLSAEESLDVLTRDFNPRCVPPWSKAELVRKVAEASNADFVDWAWLMTGLGLDDVDVDAPAGDLGEAIAAGAPPGGGMPRGVFLVWSGSPPRLSAGPPDEVARTAAAEPRAAEMEARQKRGAEDPPPPSNQQETPTRHTPSRWGPTYESVFVSRYEPQETNWTIFFDLENAPGNQRRHQIVLDRPLSVRARERWEHLRAALALPDTADPSVVFKGMRLRIELHPARVGERSRVGRFFPAIADNRARWQLAAIERFRAQVPLSDPRREKLERFIRNGKQFGVTYVLREWQEDCAKG